MVDKPETLPYHRLTLRMTDNHIKAAPACEFEISFASRLGFVDLVQEISDAICRKMGFDEEQQYWISLSIRESVTNAIEHGNKLDRSKQVRVCFRSFPNRLVVLVMDEGSGFTSADVPDPTDRENLLKPGGRGVFFVKAFMDEVAYRSLPEGGHEMRMEKKLLTPSKEMGNEH